VNIDIYLYPEAPNRFDIILRYGLSRRRKGWFPPDSEKPVIAGSLYESLVDRYGAVVGEHVFRQMFEERKGPFGEDAKYDPDKRSVARWPSSRLPWRRSSGARRERAV
jgi:hypothetical protein